MTADVDREQLVVLARIETHRFPPRTRERRAAASLAVALADTKTIDAAKRALATFTDPRTQADALDLLDRLTAQPAQTQKG